MTTDKLTKAVEEHLADKRATLFGEAFDLSSDRRRVEAQNWLRRQVAGVLARL